MRRATLLLFPLLALGWWGQIPADPPSLTNVLRLDALTRNLPAARPPRPAAPGTTFVWQTRPDSVDADLTGQPLSRVLLRLAKATGWQIFVEPGADPLISTSFTGLPAREALARLFSDVDYALLPGKTNGRPRLIVYRTDPRGATSEIDPRDSEARVKEELIVRLRNGSKWTPGELARMTDGKVVGKLDALKAARLRYADAAGADAARQKMTGMDGVELEDNYRLPPPENSQAMGGGTLATLAIKPAPVGTDRLVIGLIDTAVQPLGPGYDGFLIGHESIAPGNASPAASSSLQHGTSMFANLLKSAEATLGADGGTVHFGVLSVDVYGGAESTTSFDVALGIQKAIEGGANVINLSLSSDNNAPYLHDLIANYRRQGVLFFAAAGNEPVTTPMFPAAYAEVMAVSAGNRQGEFAAYANRGSFIDLVLPGSGIVPFGGDNWMVTGTSTSTAYASGIAGALWTPSLGAPANLEAQMRKNFGLLPVGTKP